LTTLIVVYCLVSNPYLCRELELAPIDGSIVSIPQCIRGGAMGDVASFTLDHARWRVKGWRCTEKPTAMQAWLRDKVQPN